MPMTIHLGLTKKVGLPDYGSLAASCERKRGGSGTGFQLNIMDMGEAAAGLTPQPPASRHFDVGSAAISLVGR